MGMTSSGSTHVLVAGASGLAAYTTRAEPLTDTARNSHPRATPWSGKKKVNALLPDTRAASMASCALTRSSGGASFSSESLRPSHMPEFNAAASSDGSTRDQERIRSSASAVAVDQPSPMSRSRKASTSAPLRASRRTSISERSWLASLATRRRTGRTVSSATATGSRSGAGREIATQLTTIGTGSVKTTSGSNTSQRICDLALTGGLRLPRPSGRQETRAWPQVQPKSRGPAPRTRAASPPVLVFSRSHAPPPP